MHRLRRHLGRLLSRVLRRGPRDGPDGPELQGAGVPRRPSPGGLVAAAAARPEPDGR